MNDTMTSITESDAITDESDEPTLRSRVEENPRPAVVWLAGLLVLVILEFSRLMHAVLTFGEGLGFLFDGFKAGPEWVGGNVAGTLGSLAGSGAFLVTAVLMLFIIATLVEWLLPGRILEWLKLYERLDIKATRRQRLNLERAAITAIIGTSAAILAFTPVGGLVQGLLHALIAVIESLASLPALTSPETIPNQGHRLPEGGWSGTFLGLSPAWAWTIRVSLVLLYAGSMVVWTWYGYNLYRKYYRKANWAPRDDTIRRMRGHYWGLFGLTVVFLFVVLAVWAPAISPVPVEHNVYQPFVYEFEYLSEDGTVESIAHGTANIQTRSDGQNTVAPLSYDQYDRWAPLGTTPRGQDMLTHLAHGARNSLIIGIIAIGLGTIIALSLSLISAYYKGIVDVATILASDTIISIPALLLIMLLVVIFRGGDHFLAEPLDGGLLLALILAFSLWPGMWRAIRGPSLRVAEEEWVDAAKSYGQSPFKTMRKHMAPYVAGYMMIYASLLLGAVIIITAALTFLGLGISPPTPEWGRLINQGREFIATDSWHVSTISGLMIVLVVVGFNALGDGIRDAIDPESKVARDGAAAGGGA